MDANAGNVGVAAGRVWDRGCPGPRCRFDAFDGCGVGAGGWGLVARFPAPLKGRGAVPTAALPRGREWRSGGGAPRDGTKAPGAYTPVGTRRFGSSDGSSRRPNRSCTRRNGAGAHHATRPSSDIVAGTNSI